MSKKKLEAVLNQFVAKAQELHAKIDGSWFDFMEHLVSGEDQGEMWGLQGYRSYGDFLEGVSLCSRKQYNQWRTARSLLKEEDIRVIGMHGAMQAARIHDARKRTECVRIMKEAVRADGVCLSYRRATAVYREVAGIKARSGQTERDRLKLENAQLKLELSKLKKENAALKKENAALKNNGGTGRTRPGRSSAVAVSPS